MFICAFMNFKMATKFPKWPPKFQNGRRKSKIALNERPLVKLVKPTDSMGYSCSLNWKYTCAHVYWKYMCAYVCTSTCMHDFTYVSC